MLCSTSLCFASPIVSKLSTFVNSVCFPNDEPHDAADANTDNLGRIFLNRMPVV